MVGWTEGESWWWLGFGVGVRGGRKVDAGVEDGEVVEGEGDGFDDEGEGGEFWRWGGSGCGVGVSVEGSAEGGQGG